MKTFSVTIECKVTKVVTVECKTEDQAWNNPWKYSTGELETDMIDWEVKKVEEE